MNAEKRIEQLENDLRVQKRITQAAIDSNAHWEDVSEALVWDRPQEEYESPISDRHMASVIATYPQFENSIRLWVAHWNATPRLTEEILDAVEVKPDDLERSARRVMQILNFYTKLRGVEEIRDKLAALLKEAQTMLRHTRCIDDDALKCPACSLEAQIEEVLEDQEPDVRR